MVGNVFVLRWIQQLIGEGYLDEEGETVGDWARMDSTYTMYPKSWLEKGISEWELKRCPWWLDYPLGHVPQNEENLWKGMFALLNFLCFLLFQCLIMNFRAVLTSLPIFKFSLCFVEFERVATQSTSERESPLKSSSPPPSPEANINPPLIASTLKKASTLTISRPLRDVAQNDVLILCMRHRGRLSK